MENISINIKKINEAYTSWRKALIEPQLNHNDTALLIIDMQYGCASAEYGTLKKMNTIGNFYVSDYVEKRLDTVIPNIQSLQKLFREKNAEIIYTVVCSMTKDGRDRSHGHKDLNIHIPPKSKEAKILTEIAPLEDEIVLTKTASSSFISTSLDYILKNLGILNIVVAGCYTGGCVESSVRDGHDLGYRMILAEDACFTYAKELQEISALVLNGVYCIVKETKDLIKKFNSHIV